MSQENEKNLLSRLLDVVRASLPLNALKGEHARSDAKMSTTMTPWEMWKRGFDTWERHTANYLEQALQSPAILVPGGQMLSQMMRSKANANKAMAEFWAGVGLSTRQDQERMLHALNQLQSRIYDLEERIEQLQEQRHQEEAAAAE